MILWKDDLKKSIKHVEDVSWNVEQKELLNKIANKHPMTIPKYYYDLIDQNDPDDPIKKLSFPNIFEDDTIGSYDTSGEGQNTKMPGLQHKYDKTALVLTTNACFMYCRHCFRKRMVGISSDEVNQRMLETVEYLTEHTEINNVLLSGGDSFCLSNEQIEEYLRHLTEIEHLDFIRFGTRVPVVFPARIHKDPELIEILEKYNKKKRIIIVTQFNHPRELTEEAIQSINMMKEIGISINNQTVLLKGINDEPQVLATLLNGLTRVGVDPYYLFQCRPVKGVKTGFQNTLIKSYELVQKTRPLLNGLSKRFRLIMSHVRGKVEIVGTLDNQFILKFHQAKHENDHEMIFMKPIDEDACWLDENLNPIK